MAEAATGQRILLVEDEAIIGLSEQRLLASGGYEVEYAPSAERALEMTSSSRYDLVLMDINLGPGMDGGEAARRIRERGGPPVVFLSSHSEDMAVAKTKDSGGYGYIVKGSGGKILLASIRMALGLATALRELAESEERWESLAQTAPDFIFSIGPDRRILFMNKAIEGKRTADFLGSDIAEMALPEERDSFARAIERVFRDGSTVRHHVRAPGTGRGGLARYDVYLGPVREDGRVVRATAVMRDVTGEHRLATGEPLGEAEKAAEVRSAMSAFDFASVREVLSSFHEIAGVGVTIATAEGELLSSGGNTRACVDFHRTCGETAAGCYESDSRVDAFLLDPPPGKGYAEYRCANGLEDIALPLVVEGVHWGTLFLGQFLYDDDAIDEATLSDRARRLGWDVEDYLSAIREVPRYSRERVSRLMSFFSSLGRIVTGLAYAAFRERVLSRHNLASATALGESDKRYRLLADNVGDVIWTLDPAAMRFTYVSPSIVALRGLSPEEAIAERLEDSMTPASLEKVKAAFADLGARLARGESVEGEFLTDIYEQPCKGGGTKWIEITTKPVLDESGRVVEITGVSRDATARVLADAELKRTLVEKDRVYAELQHRVKNSLALIVSLLSLEGGSIEDDETRAPLERAQVRVRSIGLLYEQLYRTRSVEDIDLGAYLPDVARAVIESPLSPRGLRLETDCASFRIDTDRAVPAGLLLYELAANAVRHAFPDKGGGRIRLSLGLTDGMVLLRVEDDGIGLPEGFDLQASGGLGSLLIVQLSAQLDGFAESGPGIDGAGAGFAVRFPLEFLTKKVG